MTLELKCISDGSTQALFFFMAKWTVMAGTEQVQNNKLSKRHTHTQNVDLKAQLVAWTIDLSNIYIIH